jgi:hypothetical protein
MKNSIPKSYYMEKMLMLSLWQMVDILRHNLSSISKSLVAIYSNLP